MLSVVIAALNSENTIGRTLSSVFSNNISRRKFEVIVVDNGSKDNTVKIAKKYTTKVFSCAKRGQGAARNLGITKANGEIVCFTDADIIVPENWLEKILGFFKGHPHVDGVGGPVLASPSGHLNNLQKLEGEIYEKTHNFPKETVESRFGDHVASLYSANCAYLKDVLVFSKGFDESGLDAVDIDLCWRLVLDQKCLMFNPEMKVIHLGFPYSLKGVFRQQFRWGESRGELNMRYPFARVVHSTLRKKIYQYYFFVLLSANMLYSRDRTMSLLQLFEKCAFAFGCVYAYLRVYFKH